MYLPVPYKISYDTQKFDFSGIITHILSLDKSHQSLEGLHKMEDYGLLVREKDQSTIWHKKYYEHYMDSFYPTYIALIKTLKEDLGYAELIYQKIPTFRVQLANGNVAVGEWHKDKTYNHGLAEVNFWLPFVDTNEQNTIWMESKEDKGDYRPYTVKYGEILVFNGANLVHGNKHNDTNTTRVSIDFRLVDPVKFIPNTAGSINMNTKFEIGGYFEKM